MGYNWSTVAFLGILRDCGAQIFYFRVTAYGIAIIRVLHERMDAPQHL
jgi:plasmid stabilization system protein ParE